MKKAKLIIINLIIFLVLVVGSISAYAYFSKVLQAPAITPGTAITDSKFIDITSLTEFYDQINLYTEPDHEFNSDDYTSLNRKTLVLQTDLYLTGDAIITSDCHINLNGHKIDLNGKVFNIKNSFAGTIAIYDSANSGVITDSLGNNQILADTPNAAFVMSAKADSNVTVKIANEDPNIAINTAFRFIYANMANASVNGFYSTLEALEAFGNQAECANYFGAHTSTNSIGCVYTKSDLELLYNFYNYDMKIDYLSSNTAVISNKGALLDSATTQEVVLTVTITYKDLAPVSKDITVHVVAPEDYQKAANMALLQYLQLYYVEVDNKLVFNNAFMMPLRNTYFGTDYVYSLSTNEDGSNPSRSDTKSDLFEIRYAVDDDTTTEKTSVILMLNKNIKSLSIISKKGNNEVSTTPILVSGKTNSAVDDDKAYCVSILTQLYGNIFSIRKKSSTEGINGYSFHDLVTDPTLNGYNRLDPNTKIQYSLVGNEEGTYQITNLDAQHDRLTVVPNPTTPPYLGQNILVNIVFTMKGTLKTYDFTIPVIYEVPENVNPGFDTFEPYFEYFDKSFKWSTNNNLNVSFNIPLFYNNKYPTYTFVVYEEDVKLPGVYKRVPSNQASNLFDIQITTPGQNPGYIDTLVGGPQSGLDSFQYNTSSRTQVNVNPFQISKETKNYYFAYIPIYIDVNGDLFYSINVTKTGADGKQEIVEITAKSLDEPAIKAELDNLKVLEYKYRSKLRVDGIVRYDIKKEISGKAPGLEEFEDVNFYKFVYNELVGGEYPKVINNTYNANHFIPTRLFDKHIPSFDFSAAGPNRAAPKFSSLKGINLLINIKSLSLANTDVTQMKAEWINQIDYISGIENLEVLNLKNTGIYDRARSGKSAMPSGTKNNFITKLNKLTKLKELDLSNNQIYGFAGIEKFTSLTKIDISNNEFTPSYGNSGFINRILNSLFKSIVNALYGTHGVTNSGYIAMVLAKKIEITLGGASSVPQVEGLLRIIDALPSLEYQDKLKSGLPLNIVYKKWTALPASDFGLITEFNQTVEGEDVQYKFVNMEFIDDANANGFTFKIKYNLVYQIYGSSETQPVDFEYHYDVERY